MEVNPQDNPELMARFRNGEALAFQQVHDLYYHAICAFVVSMINNVENAKDVAAEVFVKLWDRHKHFETLLNVKAYLYITARNDSLYYLRSARNASKRDSEYTLQKEGQAEQWLPMAAENELMEEILKEVDKLPENQRTVLRLLYTNGLSISQVAEKLKVNEGNIRIIKYRAVVQLRVILKKRNLL